MSAKSFRAVLERVEEIAPATRSFTLRLPAGRGLEFAPGQFISLGLPVGDKPIVRAYSLASYPEDPECLEICLNLLPGGPGSTYLFNLAVGTDIHFTGPWGSFVLDPVRAPRCVFVAEGAGVVPMRPLVRAALLRPETRVDLIHAVADEALLLYRDELESTARQNARFSFEPLSEGAGAASHDPLLALVRQRYVESDEDRSRHFYLCGIGDVVTRLRDLLRGAGYQRRAVHYEKW